MFLIVGLRKQIHPFHDLDDPDDLNFLGAVEMHMNISKKYFYARIYRKNDGEQNAYSDLTPTLTLTVRTPQWTHPLGNKKTFQSTTSEVPELILDAAAVPATEAIAPRHHWAISQDRRKGPRGAGDLLNLAQLPLDCGAVATAVSRTPRDHTAIRQDRCKGAVGSTDLGHLAGWKNYNSWDGIIMDGLFHGKSIDKNWWLGGTPTLGNPLWGTVRK